MFNPNYALFQCLVLPTSALFQCLVLPNHALFQCLIQTLPRFSVWSYPTTPFQCWLGKTTGSTWASLLYTIPSPTQLCPVLVLPWVHQPHEQHCYSYIPRPTQLCPVSVLTRQDYRKTRRAVLLYISIPSPTQEYPFPVFIWKTTAATVAALIYIYPVLPKYALFLCLPKKTTAATSKLCPVPLFLCLPKKTTAATRAGLIYIIIYSVLPKYALYPCICVYLKRPQQPQGQGWYT